jgi:hypothetical protein
MSATAAPSRRRPVWPTLSITLLALLLVVGTLLLTGRDNRPAAKFRLALSSSLITLTAGDSVSVQITVTGQSRFTGAVTLATTNLPDGVQASFTPASLTIARSAPEATAELRLTTAASTRAAALGIGVIGRSNGSFQSSVLSVQIQPNSITDGAPPPAPATGSGDTSFSVSGSPIGTLAPGVSLPIDLRLSNPQSAPLSIDNLTVTVNSTSIAACAPKNFTVTQFRGRYPLSIPAGAVTSLSAMGVLRSNWPVLTMRNLDTNQDACKKVSVYLRYSGSGSGV